MKDEEYLLQPKLIEDVQESKVEKLKMTGMESDIQEGKVVRWLKKVGDTVTKDEGIVEIETDKSNKILFPSQYDGVLTDIVVSEGTVVPVGETVALISMTQNIAVQTTLDSFNEGKNPEHLKQEIEPVPQKCSGKFLYLTNYFNLPIICLQRLIGVTNLFGNNYQKDLLSNTQGKILLCRDNFPEEYFKLSGYQEDENPAIILELNHRDISNRDDLEYISDSVAIIHGTLDISLITAIHVPDDDTLEMVQSQFQYDVGGFAHYQDENFQNLCQVSPSLFSDDKSTIPVESQNLNDIFKQNNEHHLQQAQKLYEEFNALSGGLHIAFNTIWGKPDRAIAITRLLNDCFDAFYTQDNNLIDEIQNRIQNQIVDITDKPKRNVIYKENNELLGIILSEIILGQEGNSWAPRSFIERISTQIQSSESLSQASKKKIVSRIETGTYSIKNVLLSLVEFKGFSESSEDEIVMDSLLIFCLYGNNLEYVSTQQWVEKYNVGLLPSILATFFAGLKIGRTRIEPIQGRDRKLDDLLCRYMWDTANSRRTCQKTDMSTTTDNFRVIDNKSLINSSYTIMWLNEEVHDITIANPIWEIFETSDMQDEKITQFAIEISQQMSWEDCLQTKVNFNSATTQIDIIEDNFVLKFKGTKLEISHSLLIDEFFNHLKNDKLPDRVTDLIYDHFDRS